ncbi:hypothetical protein AZE42_03474 [Rhizopogon vesiculosus]|uniref:Protein kinase domain-containing protein n=1 Tax=Rhizopogon vesiculosus TaxID=180088 RepID=A0A1J8QX22_9AGAM|nr:hypothetical protein AZE42_03474 [Rhizopogon vesiculosus]
MESLEKAIRREVKIWLRLEHPNIVPLLGVASIKSPFPALVSRWMPSGTLYIYVKERATTFTPSAKVEFVRGIAGGLNYLHAKNIIHGDLHPGNVLVDGSGKPCITDFGLATVVEDEELQWSAETVERDFNGRFSAPEIIGINCDPGRPTFKSDTYSFGGIMFLTVTGDIPWKGKKTYQISVELSKGTTHARPNNILDDHWKLIQHCWSWDSGDRPGAAKVLQHIAKLQLPDNVFGDCPQMPTFGGVRAMSRNTSDATDILVLTPSSDVLDLTTSFDPQDRVQGRRKWVEECTEIDIAFTSMQSATLGIICLCCSLPFINGM